MNIATLIESKVSFEKNFKNELLKMDCFFQDHLWNGYDDENDPKFITNDDFDAIQALIDKISHMVFNIGCPNSVIPMLESICTRKIKRWQGNNELLTDDHFEYVTYFPSEESNEIATKKVRDVAGFRKGKQIKSIDQLARVKKADAEILVGHFRWNNRGYILSRRCTELLEDYISVFNY